MRRGFHLALAASLLLRVMSASAAEVTAEVDLDVLGFSNVFLDSSEEWDLALRPSAELGLDFADYWSAGYAGELNAYTRHDELLSHWHQLFLYANPAWGDDGEHELAVELSLDTLRNDPVFEELNNLRPRLLVRIAQVPYGWLSWQLELDATYRWFYNDRPSDSVDAWISGQIGFTLPSRTTVIPRVAYGYRHYPLQDTLVTRDVHDQQLELGLRIGQALWSAAGLQLDYRYRLAIGESGLLLRKLTLDQFSYLGEEFLFSGHQARAGLKQLLGERWKFEASLAYQQRRFAGWQVVDESTWVLLDEQREDHRLTPGLRVSFSWWPADQNSAFTPEVELGLEYRFTRQWSNQGVFDTRAHVGGLSLWLGW